MRHALLVLTFAGPVLLAISCGKAPPSGGVATALADAPVIRAIEVWNAYEENALKADQAYKGKVVRITDAVEKIGSVDGKYFIGFAVAAGGPPSPPNTLAYLSPLANDKAAQLKPGDEVIITGKCVGTKPDETVWKKKVLIFEDCTVEKK